MKRITILLLIICTLSGCGLFKKTSKEVEKHEQFGKTEQLTESKKEAKEQVNEQSNKKTKEQSNGRESKDIDSETTLEADEINIDDKGNISAKGNAKLNNKLKDKGTTEKSANKEVLEDSNKQTNIDSKEHNKSNTKEETKQKDHVKIVESVTDFWGIIAGAIGVVIIVVGVIIYLKKK